MRWILVFLAVFLAPTAHSASLRATADDSANIVSKILGSFQGTDSMNLTHFFTSFDMPTCLRRCMPTMDNIGAVLETSRSPDALRSMCSNLTESTECATAAGCNSLFVGAISNAFQFMCMDNLDKISAQIACMQDSAGDLQQECESECAVQSEMIEKAAKKGADELFNMESMCNSTACLAHCYEANIQKYCEIGEENNLFDTIFSQLDALEEQKPGIFGVLDKKRTSEKKGIGKLIGWMLPKGCDDETLKIKIPKKLPMPDVPKSVGKQQMVGSEKSSQKSSQKTDVPKNTMASEQKKEALMTANAKTANFSSAAVLVGGKVQTLQCQMLDSKGEPLKTPGFERIYEILQEHFDKKSAASTTPKPASEEPKVRTCRETEESAEPRSSSSATIGAAILAVFPLFAAVYL